MMVVSFNPGYRRGLKELKPSTRQRFVALEFGYPPAEVEAEIVQAESGVVAGVARGLVGYAAKVRLLEELGLGGDRFDAPAGHRRTADCRWTRAARCVPGGHRAAAHR